MPYSIHRHNKHGMNDLIDRRKIRPNFESIVRPGFGEKFGWMLKNGLVAVRQQFADEVKV